MNKFLPGPCDDLCDEIAMENAIFALFAARIEQLIYSGFSDDEAIELAEKERLLRIEKLEAGKEAFSLLGKIVPVVRNGIADLQLELEAPVAFARVGAESV